MWELLLLLVGLVALYLFWPRKKAPSETGRHTSGSEARTASRPTTKPRGDPVDTSTVARHWESDAFDFEVVGESHYQASIAAIAESNRRCVATLILESTNAYDKSAVRVEIGGRQVGYLSREDARSFRRRLGAAKLTGKRTTCDAEIRGGGTAKDGRALMYGVALSMKPFG